MNNGIRTLRQEQNMAVWATHVEECNNSGLSVAQWCRNNNIPVSTFWSRQKTLRSMQSRITNLSIEWMGWFFHLLILIIQT